MTSIENNHKKVPQAKKGTSVAIKIVNDGNPNMMYGRHFDANSALYSKISRASIDALKEFFKRFDKIIYHYSFLISVVMLVRRNGNSLSS